MSEGNRLELEYCHPDSASLNLFDPWENERLEHRDKAIAPSQVGALQDGAKLVHPSKNRRYLLADRFHAQLLQGLRLHLLPSSQKSTVKIKNNLIASNRCNIFLTFPKDLLNVLFQNSWNAKVLEKTHFYSTFLAPPLWPRSIILHVFVCLGSILTIVPKKPGTHNIAADFSDPFRRASITPYFVKICRELILKIFE